MENYSLQFLTIFVLVGFLPDYNFLNIVTLLASVLMERFLTLLLLLINYAGVNYMAAVARGPQRLIQIEF